MNINMKTMRIKVLSILMAAALALAFTSCDKKGNSSASVDSDSTSSKSESVSSNNASDESGACSESSDSTDNTANKNENEVKFDIKDPTGDVVQDAKYVCDKTIEIYSKDINSDKDAFTCEMYKSIVTEKYNKFYKEKGPEELKKYKDELEKLMENDPLYSEKMNEAKEKIEKNEGKAIRYMKESQKDFDGIIEKHKVDEETGEITLK